MGQLRLKRCLNRACPVPHRRKKITSQGGTEVSKAIQVDELKSVDVDLGNGGFAKFYFARQSIEDLWRSVPEMFDDYCRSLPKTSKPSKVSKVRAFIIAVGEKIRPHRYSPQRDLAIRKEIANLRFMAGASNEQRYAMARRDCAHCGKPDCAIRLYEYQCECTAVCNQELRMALRANQFMVQDLQDEIATERMLRRPKRRDD